MSHRGPDESLLINKKQIIQKNSLVTHYYYFLIIFVVVICLFKQTLIMSDRVDPMTRVPGLPIRDCKGSCNSSEHRRTTVSAIDVIAKTFFERLYLVPALSPFEPRVNCPCAPTPPPFAKQLFLDLCEFFLPEWPLNIFVITIHQVIWPSPGILPMTHY